MNEIFSRACGRIAPLRLEIVEEPGTEGRSWLLDRPFAVVGRDPTADLVLNHPIVSHRHAYLQVLDGQLWVIDLGSRSGITRPGGREAATGVLDPGESIGIGPIQIRLTPEPVDPEAHATSDRPPRADPALTFELERLDTTGPSVSWPLNSPVTLVGRSPRCEIQLDDPTVSRVHAAIVQTAEGPWAVDLLGRGGLLIAGVMARHGRLEPGDALGVGRFRLQLRLASTALATLPAPLDALLPTPAWGGSVPAEVLGTLGPVGPETSPVLVLLIEQFGRMQMQMLDQFNRAMQALLSRLGEQQTQELERVRGELAHLRGLADELQGLKQTLNAPTAPPAPTRRSPALTPDTPSSLTPTIPDEPASLEWVYRRLGEIQGEQERRWGHVFSLIRKKQA